MATTRQQTRVCVVYPADPAGAVPGGIDTFIRGVLRWAPDDISFDLIGATTDVGERPVGKWTRCDVGGKEYNFYPLMALTSPGVQSWIPTSLVFTGKLVFSRRHREADVIEFHGLEPSVALLWDTRPKTAVIHTDMRVLTGHGTTIRWRYAPALYYALERLLVPRMHSVYCVRDTAVRDYQTRFPAIAERFRFTPTWVDSRIFSPGTKEIRSQDRRDLCAEFNFSTQDRILITVGRLVSEKNPQLLIEAFDIALRDDPRIRLIMVGDGKLRRDIETLIAEKGLEDRIVPCGIRKPDTISKFLRASDTFVLSSNYEGMPMCVLEALGSGLPVVTTDVGEIRRVVHPGINGEIVGTQDVRALASAVVRCIAKLDLYKGEPCTSAVSSYSAQSVLEPIYKNYRNLALSVDHVSSI